MNYKLSLAVSDLKGEIEGAKLDIINYTIAALVGIVVIIGFGFKMLVDHQSKKEKGAITRSESDIDLSS